MPKCVVIFGGFGARTRGSGPGIVSAPREKVILTVCAIGTDIHGKHRKDNDNESVMGCARTDGPMPYNDVPDWGKVQEDYPPCLGVVPEKQASQKPRRPKQTIPVVVTQGIFFLTCFCFVGQIRPTFHPEAIAL